MSLILLLFFALLHGHQREFATEMKSGPLFPLIKNVTQTFSKKFMVRCYRKGVDECIKKDGTENFLLHQKKINAFHFAITRF